ncbi:sigma-70 family RNA polymerase sigma factor, partial [Chryseobacterium indologenes]|uniref:sigma-70 family RNA polymerase sigma factor n=2 Tax=Chryseobacterium indologenes TaxID=253 RepID=UPI001887796D
IICHVFFTKFVLKRNIMQEKYNSLLTYAYNITGSYEDSQDLVQDVIEKYISLDKSEIRNETNFLIKSTINHAINFKNRHGKKMVYGEWLPEPLSFENAENKLIKEQTARYTLLVLLEKLNARERAVYILKEAFDYSHQEIAETLDISVENSRKLLSRAGQQLQDIKYEPDSVNISVHTDILQQYQLALSEGDIPNIEKLLTDAIKLSADGGKRIRVIKAVEVGKSATAQLLAYVQQQFLGKKPHSFHIFNHQPAICFWQDNRIYNCHILDIDANGMIREIYSIVDPEKLKRLQ